MASAAIIALLAAQARVGCHCNPEYRQTSL